MRSSLALVRKPEAKDAFDGLSDMLKRSFLGWWYSRVQKTPRLYTKPLTTADFLEVNLVTVRESSSHRRWPPEIVKTFLAADVIKARSEDRSPLFSNGDLDTLIKRVATT